MELKKYAGPLLHASILRTNQLLQLPCAHIPSTPDSQQPISLAVAS